MRNSWYLKNKTSREFSLGDLPGLPSIPQNKLIDLLRFYSQDEIVNSSTIKKLFNEGKIDLIKIEDGVKTIVTSIAQLTQAAKESSDLVLEDYQLLSEKDEPSGYAGLDEDGNLNVNQILVRTEDSATLAGIVLEEGELAYTTDSKRIYVGDGVTAGGIYSTSDLFVPLQLEVGGNAQSVLVIPTISPCGVVDSGSTGTLSVTPSTGVSIQSFTYSEVVSAGANSITSLVFTNLVQIGGSLTLGMAPCTTLSFPELTTVGGAFTPQAMNLLTTLSLPELTTLGGAFGANNLAALTALSLPELTTVGGAFSPNTMALLTTISLPSLVTVASGFGPNTMASLTTFSIPELTFVGATFNPNTMASLTTLNAPSLTTVVGAFQPGTMAACTSINIPSLVSVGGNFNAGTMSTCTTVNASSLVTVGGNFSINSMSLLTTLTVTSLTTVSGTFSPSSLSSLTTLNLPSLTTLVGTFNPSGMAACTTISIPALIDFGSTTSIPSASMANVTTTTIGTVGVTKRLNGNITMSGLKLTQASVDQILAVVASLDGTNGTTSWGTGKTLALSGGTNSTPSAGGLANKAIIVARGGTVTNN